MERRPRETVRRFRRRLRDTGVPLRHHVVRRLAARLGWHLAPRRNHLLLRRWFYSPVPDLEELEPDVWRRESAMGGIAFDPAAHIDFAERELARFIPEFDAPANAPDGPGGYFVFNDYYETGDAELTYAMVRYLKPRRVVELGSGYSTHVLARACRANSAEGHAAQLQAFDHDPTEVGAAAAAGAGELHRSPAQEVPLSVFESLEEGDVLFVDTSHTVKLGGEVNFIVLEVLPLLSPGVVVHFHDIWLPGEYHPVLVRDMEMFWNEQYLLQAFLSFNEAYEVLLATRAVATMYPERLERLIPAYSSQNFPSSFWIRRRGGSRRPDGPPGPRATGASP